MIYPKFIDNSSCIGVPAPSAGASSEEKMKRYINAKTKLEQLGYKIILSKNIMNDETGRSATAKERGDEINAMFSNENIDLILCAAGGDFLVECLPYVDFDLLKNHPKFVCGFSDPTGLLYTITSKYDIATIYGNNFSSFGAESWDDSQKDFLKIINGDLSMQHSYSLYEDKPLDRISGLEGYNLTENVYWHTLDDEAVNIKGRMLGGCFDIISELSGTKYDGITEFNKQYKDDGIIWFFDNCEISMEETIRTLWKFNELGYFKYVRGVIFGRFGVDTTCYGYDTKTCLNDSILCNLNIPIVYDADISHKAQCMPIINGALATIEVKDGNGTIEFELR